MRLWSLLNARNPVWRVSSIGLLGLVLGMTAWYIIQGPKPLEPTPGGTLFRGTQGERGTVTEQLGRGRFVLTYATLLGEEKSLELLQVKGRLEEPETLWLMEAPTAQRQEGIWTLDGPLQVSAQDPRTPGRRLGQGDISSAGPALQWDHGVWRGLAPLSWTDLEGDQGGIWHLPPGWHRELDGRLFVDQGPVVWEATRPGTLRRMVSQRLWMTLGFGHGHLETVVADLEGGRLQAGAADMDPATLTWSPPITLERNDGWFGQARSGVAPRPKPGEGLSVVELTGFSAHRATEEGPERLAADGVRWTTAGLRLEGAVRWEQPLDGQRLVLQGPRVLIREGQGPDLPKELPIGEAWAEGQPVLSWGQRSITSPRMEARRSERIWRMQAPVLGRGEQGTFTAGQGSGSPRRWTFSGPIRAQVVNGGSLRGDRLDWEDNTWTLLGSPATWTRLRERLAGPRVVRQGEAIRFPEGLSGALAAPDGDLQIRADQGEGQGRTFELRGRVECLGLGWRLNADRISVTLGPGNTVKLISAKGAVTLRGRMGEGWGEALELDPGTRTATWQGRVRGLAEVTP